MARLKIQAWDPAFGSETAFEQEEEDAALGKVDPEVEMPLTSWRPLDAPRIPPEPVVFVDGVRRVDARAFVENPGEPPTPALLASLAVGLCRCDGRATLERISIRRLLLCHTAQDALHSPAGDYRYRPVPEAGLSGLMNGLRQALRDLEQDVAESLVSRHLTVVDGPLSGTLRGDLDLLIGYIKSHHTRYLTGDAEAVLARLQPLQRTPLFLLEAPWPRFSCYLRLPGREADGVWSALCRIEISASTSLETAVARVGKVAARLPAFASRSYREPRAPQNLFPIAGLEATLRNRLGDALVVYRGLLRVQ